MFIGLLSTVTTTILSESLASNSKEYIKYVSLNNRPCQARLTFVNINSNEPLYYPFTVSVDKCGESCNTMANLYDRICFPDKVKSMNVNKFSLISGINEARRLVQHESYEFKCWVKMYVVQNKNGIMSMSVWV